LKLAADQLLNINRMSDSSFRKILFRHPEVNSVFKRLQETAILLGKTDEAKVCSKILNLAI
jgi:hypothetical protein